MEQELNTANLTDNFGPILEAICKEKGITLKRLSEIVGIPLNTISKYKNDSRSPSVRLLVKLVNELNVNPLFLFSVTKDILLKSNSAEEKAKELENENKRLKIDMELLEGDLESMAVDIIGLEVQIEDYQKQCNNFQNQIDNFQKQIDDSKKQRGIYKEQRDKIKKKLDESEKLNDKYLKKLMF
jgi:transcriptional regulator with XRE-family HTH domain